MKQGFILDCPRTYYARKADLKLPTLLPHLSARVTGMSHLAWSERRKRNISPAASQRNRGRDQKLILNFSYVFWDEILVHLGLHGQCLYHWDALTACVLKFYKTYFLARYKVCAYNLSTWETDWYEFKVSLSYRVSSKPASKTYNVRFCVKEPT